MDSSFTSEFFAGNRQRLRDLFTGTAPIVLTANGLLQRGADVVYPFAQDASFWYLTGIDEPDILLVMDRDKEYGSYQSVPSGAKPLMARSPAMRSAVVRVSKTLSVIRRVGSASAAD